MKGDAASNFGMKWWGYLILAVLAYVAAHVGGGVYAAMRIAGETPQAALADYLRYASMGSELYLSSPFLLLGALCGWFSTQARTRGVLAIFAVAISLLVCLYLQRNWGIETALHDEAWTAAALGTAFLPIVAVPIVLVAAILGLVATGFDARDACTQHR